MLHLSENKPLKIALYFFRLASSSGGAERMLFELSNLLAKLGHEVHIISWDQPDAKSFYSLPKNVQWHRLSFALGSIDKLRRTAILYKTLKKINCKIFVGFVMSADKTVYAACALAGVPVITAERNSPEMYKLKFGPITRAFYMVLFLMAKKIIIQLEDYRYGYPKWLNNRIKTIPNPVNKAKVFASPAKKKNEKLILLCVARLEEQKNIPALVKAFSLISENYPEWYLRIVGEGKLKKTITDLILELSLKDKIYMAGAINNIDSEYSNANLFCLPSVWEGFPNALAEAMSHGLPVVGFADCPGVNRLIVNGENGVLATGNGDVFQLAIALSSLMCNSQMRVEMGKRAAQISEEFDSEAIAMQWESTLIRVVKKYG